MMPKPQPVTNHYLLYLLKLALRSAFEIVVPYKQNVLPLLDICYRNEQNYINIFNNLFKKKTLAHKMRAL